MKQITIVFFILAIFSCNSKYGEYNEFDDMYNIFSGDFERDIFDLTIRNNELFKLIILDTTKSVDATKFHKLISEYNEYIELVESKLLDSNKNPFFSNDSISELGTEYIAQINLYREKLLPLIKEENFKKRVNFKLITDSPQNRNGEIIPHINYYFQGIRQSGSIAYLKNKRRNALEIEYEYFIKIKFDE